MWTKKLAFLIIFSSSVLVCSNSCVHNTENISTSKEPKLPTNKECIEFIHFFLKTKICALGNNIMVSDRDYEEFTITSSDSAMILSKVPVLSEKDVLFIRKQLTTNSAFKFKENTLCNTNIISADSVISFIQDDSQVFWSLIRKKYGDKCLVRISKPAFSIDKSVVLVRYSKMCNEMSGFGGIVVYEKNKHNWVLKIVLNSWIV